jgi:hypothetical protein
MSSIDLSWLSSSHCRASWTKRKFSSQYYSKAYENSRPRVFLTASSARCLSNPISRSWSRSDGVAMVVCKLMPFACSNMKLVYAVMVGEDVTRRS